MTVKTDQNARYCFLLAAFLNAFTDLGHKITLQNTVFKLYEGATQVVMTAMINALMLLPFILLLTPAGLIADRHPKLHVMQRAAMVAVALCFLITVFYLLGWFIPAFAMTLALAIQAAIYSPAKYGFVREHFGKEQLGEMNGLLSALSITAILAGTFVYSIVFEFWYEEGASTPGAVLSSVAGAGFLLLAGSVLELLALLALKPLAAAQPSSDVSAAAPGEIPLAPLPDTLNTEDMLGWSQQRRMLATLWQHKGVRLSAIGLSVFWAVGQVLLATFPAFAKDAAGIDNPLVLQGVLACTGIGIGFGSVYAGRYSRHYIETGLLPFAALGIAIGLLVLPTLTSTFWMGIWMLLTGFAGGVFTVPLNALIQYHAKPAELGRVLAASNWLQNIAMLLLLLLTMLFALLGWRSSTLLTLTGVIACIGAAYTLYQLPQSFTRVILTRVVSTSYRIKVQGMRHIPNQGGVLLLGNHVSWIDWAIVQIACPRPVRFVMISSIYNLWYLNWFFKLFGSIPIQAGAASRKSLDEVAAALRYGEVVCLFPEGVISRNGQLAEFRRGYEKALAQVDDTVVIVPFYLRGLWGSLFSRAGERLRRNRHPNLSREIVVDFGTALPKTTQASELKQVIRELGYQSWELYADNLPTIGQHWVDTCKRAGNPVVLVDTLTGASLRAKQALTGAIILARRFRQMSPEQNVGLLLPSSSGSVLGNLALAMLGKTIVNLNFTASSEALVSAVQQAELKTIYTSSRFLDKLQARGINLDALSSHARFVMLEDFRAATSTAERVQTLLACFLLPATVLKWLYCKAHSIHDIAVILFSSGSEGEPKGVTLTHRNLLTNIKQITELLNFSDDDVMIANLPPFHAFGLTVTHFAPAIEGVPLVCHADPTDVYGAAQAIANYRVTMMFGTCSFYRLYVRNTKVHPLMLQSLRLCIAGAEKLQDEVRKEFKLKFNKDILEGYGATETAPVASVNVPDQISPDNWQVQVAQKPGSVGMALPGTSFRIVDPDTFATLPAGEAGMILISGAQVMPGYLNNESKTRNAVRMIDGKRWYVSFDKGYLDDDGFLYLIDRYSRFAKISGEMVGLGTVEQAIRAVVNSDDFEVVVVNLPDEKKGEKLIALSTHALDPGQMRDMLLANGLNALALPVLYAKVDAIPRLGSGKTDFGAAKLLAQRLLQDSA